MNSYDQSGGPAPAKAERRVVIVDDQDVVRDMLAMAVRNCFGEVTVLKFDNRDEAWKELLRRDPDLLITDLRGDNVPVRTADHGTNGFELLKLLAERRVTYPVLVASGSLEIEGYESHARQCAGPDLNLLFLMKPFTAERFIETVGRCLGLRDNECGTGQ